MRVSAKAEYACVAMLELAASHGNPQPLRVKAIADAHGIPPRFLVQILLQLKGAGLVASTRGAAGGYQLVKPPEEITLGMVMGIIEGKSVPTSNVEIETPTVRALLGAWRDADRAVHR